MRRNRADHPVTETRPVWVAIIGIAIIGVLWPVLEACRYFLGVNGPAVLITLALIGATLWGVVRMPHR